MRIAVVGGGAIGLLFTVLLNRAGISAKLVTRTEKQSQMVRDEGISFTDLSGASHSVKVEVYAQSEATEIPDVDWTFLTVKQPHVMDVLPFLNQWQGFGRVLCFQNGMGHMEQLAQHISSDLLHAAVTTEAAYRKEANHVVYAGKGETWAGAWQLDSAAVHQLTQKLEQSGLPFHYDSTIEGRIWKKLLMNSVINPLTALYKVTNGQLLENPHLTDMMNQLWKEGHEVAKREQVAIDGGFWQEIIGVCRSTYHNKSSMLQDILSGRKTEVDAINGYLVQKGKAHGLAMDVHRFMVSGIHAKEEKMAKEGEVHGDVV